MNMSFKSSSDEASQTLSLEISGLSSADSSLTSSPVAVLSFPSSLASSTRSLPGTLSVRFAPLPETVPRKRRSAVPLGVAARSQMMLQRRKLRGMSVDSYHRHPIWTEEELEQQRELAMQEGRRRRNQHHFLVDEDAEDPLVAFGRMVRDAGKSLFRKVSIKDLSRKVKKKDSSPSREKVIEHDVEEASTSKEDKRPAHTPRLLDDHDEELLRTVGHTKTIREGDAQHIWISEDLLDDPTGPRSTPH